MKNRVLCNLKKINVEILSFKWRRVSPLAGLILILLLLVIFKKTCFSVEQVNVQLAVDAKCIFSLILVA